MHKMHDPNHVLSEPSTLENSVSLCEGAVLPLKVMHTLAADAVWATGDRLRSVHAAHEELREDGVRNRGSLDEAVSYCETAVDPLEARIRKAEHVLAEEQRRRQEAEARLVKAVRSTPCRNEEAVGVQAEPLRAEQPAGLVPNNQAEASSGRELNSCRNHCAMM